MWQIELNLSWLHVLTDIQCRTIHSEVMDMLYSCERHASSRTRRKGKNFCNRPILTTGQYPACSWTYVGKEMAKTCENYSSHPQLVNFHDLGIHSVMSRCQGANLAHTCCVHRYAPGVLLTDANACRFPSPFSLLWEIPRDCDLHYRSCGRIILTHDNCKKFICLLGR